MAVAAIAVLAVIGSVMNSRQAAAQGPPNGLAVNIVNPLPVPVTGSTTVSGTVNLAPGATVTVGNLLTVVSAADLNPYQESKQFSWNTPSCGNVVPSQCNVTFSPVPAGKRLVVQTVSAQVNSLFAVEFASLSTPSTVSYLPSVLQTTESSSFGVVSGYIIDSQVLLYFEPGQVPTFSLKAQGNNVSFVNVVSISGHFVQLP
jgi:hypothetical protein